GYPVSVYLTTYYSDYNRPVFDPMCAYLFWKGTGKRLELPGILNGGGADSENLKRILLYAKQQSLNGVEKDRLLANIADQLGIDYEALCKERLLTLMRPAEVSELAAAGVDFQLHTHRHRAYRERKKWLREIDENQERITAATGSRAQHFCYPSGFYLPEYPGWLREHGVTSGTTCEPGLAQAKSDLCLLPRLMDTRNLSDTAFRGWITGVAEFLPKRRSEMSDWPLMD
ncbi:MAG: polysaccharide deacetylase family protein, partial [Bryobacteraceae bacterium]